MKFEIIHDTIAKQVFEKASIEARTRRKVEKFIRERFEAHQLRGAKLTQDDLDYIQPYLTQVNISEEESAFLEKNRKSLADARTRIRVIVAGVIIFLLGSTAFSLVQWKDAIEQKEFANTQKEYADEQTLKALKAQRADSIKAIELGIALEEAQAAKDTAEVARIKAEQEKLRADVQAKIALKRQLEALQNAKEAEALSYSTISKSQNLEKMEVSLRLLQEAYLKTYPKPPPPLIQEALANKFYAQKANDNHAALPLPVYFSHTYVAAGDLRPEEDYTEENKGIIKGFSISSDEEFLLSYSKGSRIKLWDRKGNLLHQFDEHTENIVDASFSPDGKLILSNSFDESAKLWNHKGKILADMRMVNDYEGLRSRIHGARFSPDGEKIITQVGDSLKLWNLRGQKLRDLTGETYKLHKDFILSKDLKNLYLWDYQGKLIKELNIPGAGISDFYIFPNGNQYLSILKDGEVVLGTKKGQLFSSKILGTKDFLETEGYREGEEAWKLESHTLNGSFLLKSNGLKLSLLFDKEGEFLKELEGTYTFFDPAATELYQANLHPKGIEFKQLDLKGNPIHSELIETPLSSKEEVHLLNDHRSLLVRSSRNTYIHLKLDENKILSTSSIVYDSPRDSNSRIPLLQFISSNQDATVFQFALNLNYSIDAIIFVNRANELLYTQKVINYSFESPNSKYSTNPNQIYISQGNHLRKVDFQGALLKEYEDAAYSSAVLSHNQKYILFTETDRFGSGAPNSEKLIKLHNLATGSHSFLEKSQYINEISFTADDSYILGIQVLPDPSRQKGNKSLCVWDLTGKLLGRKEHNSSKINYHLLPNSTVLLESSNFQKNLSLWDVKTNKLMQLSHDEYIDKVEVSSDGKYLLTYARSGGVVKLWAKEGKLIFEKDTQASRISDALFSPDGKSILINASDHVLRRWDIQGRLLKKTPPLKGHISSLCFHPDGKSFLITYDGKMESWNLSFQNLKSFSQKGLSIYSATFTPKGSYIWITSDQGAKVWDKEGRLISSFDHFSRELPVFSPDESMFYALIGEDTGAVYTIYGELLTRKNYGETFESFSPKGTTYCMAYNYNFEKQRDFHSHRIFDRSGNIIANLETDSDDYFIAYSSDGESVFTLKNANISQWPLPTSIFKYLQEEATFPELNAEQKKEFGIK
ncbi:MAG: hypothetical protein R8P61_25435 [Bacteroidia bacterium]|nr:hypothetical protein [Bacteroidia bacterium]